MGQFSNLNVSEIVDRMKAVASIKTDAELGSHLGVSNKTVSSWRTRNSLPIEAVLQIAEETGRKIEYFLLGDESERPSIDLSAHFSFGDLRIRDFELAGESILAGLLEQFAPDELAFMDDSEMTMRGQQLGMQIAQSLALVRQERRALLDNGKLDEDAFEIYVRKAFRFDLPHFTRALKNKKKIVDEGPQ